MKSYVIEFVFNLTAVEICQVWLNEDREGGFVWRSEMRTVAPRPFSVRWSTAISKTRLVNCIFAKAVRHGPLHFIGNGRPNIVNHLISNNLHHTTWVGWDHNLCLLSCSRYCHLSTMFPSTCKDTWTVFTLCHYILSNILQRPVL